MPRASKADVQTCRQLFGLINPAPSWRYIALRLPRDTLILRSKNSVMQPRWLKKGLTAAEASRFDGLRGAADVGAKSPAVKRVLHGFASALASAQVELPEY